MRIRWLHGLWLVFILIHLSFYVSALVSGHLQHFFVEGSIQLIPVDFRQIPNGAQSYFEGGEIIGTNRPYPVIKNAYHPATTVVLGGILQLIDLESGFVLYTMIKFCLTLLLVRLLWIHYAESPDFSWALFIFLTCAVQAVDIGCGQYHFLLNLFVFLFLHDLNQSKSTGRLGGHYFGSLMIKPIGLLWIPQLLIERRYAIVFWPVGLWAALTGACWFMRGGAWYVEGMLFFSKNSIQEIVNGIPSNGGRYTLETILRYLGTSDSFTQTLKFSVPFVILGTSLRFRISLFSSLFLWTCYYLIFYSRVYIYHYTTLIPFFTLGVLTQPEFKTKFVKTLMFFSCLPSPYFLFKLLDVFVEGPVKGPHRDVVPMGYFVMICLRIVPVILIAASVVLYNNRTRRTPSSTEPEA